MQSYRSILAMSKYVSQVMLPMCMGACAPCVIFDQLPTHPSCSASWDSSVNAASLTTVAKAGLTKFIVLPVSTIVKALQLLTFAHTMKHVHSLAGTNSLGPGGPTIVSIHIVYLNAQPAVSAAGHSAIIQGPDSLVRSS